MLLLARAPADGTYLRDVLPPLLLLAAGAGLSYAPTFIAGTTGVPDHYQGLASGFLNSAQELGAAMGVTVLGALATAATVGGGVAALTSGYRAGLLTAAAAIAAGMILIAGLPDTTTTTRRCIPPRNDHAEQVCPGWARSVNLAQ